MPGDVPSGRSSTSWVSRRSGRSCDGSRPEERASVPRAPVRRPLAIAGLAEMLQASQRMLIDPRTARALPVTTIGLIAPGEMRAAVGAAVTASEATVFGPHTNAAAPHGNGPSKLDPRTSGTSHGSSRSATSRCRCARHTPRPRSPRRWPRSASGAPLRRRESPARRGATSLVRRHQPSPPCSPGTRSKLRCSRVPCRGTRR